MTIFLCMIFGKTNHGVWGVGARWFRINHAFLLVKMPILISRVPMDPDTQSVPRSLPDPVPVQEDPPSWPGHKKT